MGLEALGRRGVLGGALALLLTAQAGPVLAADLKVGANIGNVPWEFQDASGNFVGFEIDLVNEVAKRLGRTVEVVNIPFQGLFAAVQSGQIDAAVSSITITPKRLASVSFAQPYYDSDQSLTVTAASGIKGLEDMKGKTVAVDTGSTGDIWATAHQAEYGFGEIRRFEGLAPAMLDLQAGRIDGYISDIPALLYYTKDKPAFAVVERIPTGEKYSIMFAKDAPLAGEVNAILGELKREGFIAALHETWFGAKADAATTTVQPADMPKAS
jgi:polar amino acid transport system substrate-binding protein